MYELLIAIALWCGPTGNPIGMRVKNSYACRDQIITCIEKRNKAELAEHLKPKETKKNDSILQLEGPWLVQTGIGECFKGVR